MEPNNETIVSWEAPEYRYYEKNMGWYITLGAIVLLLVAYQAYLKDWFGAITIVILAIIASVFARQTPRQVIIAISTKGISIDGALIPYRNIRYFWIVDTENHKTLNLETTAYVNRILVLELEEQDSETIRSLLMDILPEHETARETFAQRLAHRFKF